MQASISYNPRNTFAPRQPGIPPYRAPSQIGNYGAFARQPRERGNLCATPLPSSATCTTIIPLQKNWNGLLKLMLANFNLDDPIVIRCEIGEICLGDDVTPASSHSIDSLLTSDSPANIRRRMLNMIGSSALWRAAGPSELSGLWTKDPMSCLASAAGRADQAPVPLRPEPALNRNASSISRQRRRAP